jgi:hypothetical protein
LPRNPRVNIYESLWAEQKTKLPLALSCDTNPLGAKRSCSTPLHRTTMPSPQFTSSRHKFCDPATCLSSSKLLGARRSHLRPPSLRSWFCVSTKSPDSFVVNSRKPRVQTLVVSLYPASAPVHNFVLLFLPPCGPHLTPLATGSLEPSLLVSPLLGGPAGHRPLAPDLHLHQHK